MNRITVRNLVGTATGWLLLVASGAIDFVSVLARYLLVLWWLGVSYEWIALLAGFWPYLWSLATALGLPSGFLFTRLALGARAPSQREQAAVEQVFAELTQYQPKLKPPRFWFVVDGLEANAFVVGSTLYIERELIQTPHLKPILAHELGHLTSSDGRLTLAMRRLLFPGMLKIATLLGQASTSTIEEAQVQVRLQHQGAAKTYGCLAGSFGWLRLLFLVFSGGLGIYVLSPLWAAYWRQREFEADAYAARLGQAAALADALDHILLLDTATPFMFGRAHPYTEQRIDRLMRYAQESQLSSGMMKHQESNS